MTDEARRVAMGLTKAQREALLFFDQCDLPEAENAEEVALIGEMMRLCLAGKIILKGRVFMDCQPLGLAVRTILQETDNAN